MSQLIRRGLSDTLTPLFFATLAIAGTLAALACFLRVENGAFRSHFDLFSVLMSSPMVFLFPAVVALASCLPLYGEIGHRFISNVRPRVAIRAYIHSKLIVSVGIGFAIGFFGSLVAVIVAYWVSPLVGDPGILPDAYGMTPVQAQADALTSSSYSSLLAMGPTVFGLAYSIWVGLAGAAFAAIATAALILLGNRVIAVMLPFLLYAAETLIAALAGAPHFGILYSVFPFGLTQQPIGEAASPALVLLVVTVAFWVWFSPRLGRAERLS